MTSSKSIGVCPTELTLTIRAGAEERSSGSSSLVSRNPAR
jgi:hypothetical protein